MPTDTLATSATHALWADESLFRANFDRAPFPLQHSLAGQPLFEIPRLLQLARGLKRNPNNINYDSGEIHVEDRWNQRPPNQYTLEEAMERIDRTGAWVILKHTELDPQYRALMDDIMSDVDRMSGYGLRKATKNLEAQIMIASPGRVTPFHMDNECNVLLQITGEKDIFVFDQTDREILTESESENFWFGNWNAAEYKSRYQERGKHFRLVPGKAVHIPVNAPHWVKNDNNVSVSLSINFEWRDESLYNVYRANFFLRKMGLRPRPPRQSPASDKIKSTAVAIGFVPARNLARNTVRFMRRLKSSRTR